MELKIELERDGSRDLRLQIYEQIRSRVESGELADGFRLPPSRELAERLSVSRKTVAEAYQQLLTEGFIITRGKGGTFVRPLSKAKSFVVPEQTGKRVIANLSEYGQSVGKLSLASLEPQEGIANSLYSSNPDVDRSASVQWFERALSRLNVDIAQSDPASALGHRKLRQAICRYVASSRGIVCDEDEVAIFPTFPQFIDLAVRLHVSMGDTVVVEDPCYPAMRESAVAYGASVYPIPVDEHGIMVDRLPGLRRSHPCKLIFLTAAHQFPKGSVLSIERRYRVLEWAGKHGTVVIDDDYDSDLFFKGFAPPSMKSMKNSDLVIYVSSLKKLVPSSFSIDFAILPRSLCRTYSQAMKLSQSLPAIRSQLALAEFLDSGELLRQIRRMKTIYAVRREKVRESLIRHFGARLTISGANCGLDMVVRIDSNVDDAQIVRRALAMGVEVRTTANLYHRKAVEGEFIIGYARIEDDQIDQAVAQFARAAGINQSDSARNG